MTGKPRSSQGTIHQLNVSNGGVPKLPLGQARALLGGLEGDAQADRKHHGGSDRALCLFSLDRINELAAEDHPIAAGNVGENVTIEGLDWSLVTPGARLKLGGEVLVEVTSYTQPCWKIASWFADGDFNRMNQKTYPGCSRVYARVLEEGLLRSGDTVELLTESAVDRVARLQPPTIRWRPPDSN
jgi:MOSC domain-containing protein YiiM